MGCFSFMCKETGKAVNSTSFDGTPVHMFLLKQGKVIEHMYGNYDSYGRVFAKDGMKKSPPDSMEWKLDWGDVCNLMFDNNKSNGIAVISASHWNEGMPLPTTRSDGDPDQGWSDEGPWEEVEEPFHRWKTPIEYIVN